MIDSNACLFWFFRDLRRLYAANSRQVFASHGLLITGGFAFGRKSAEQGGADKSNHQQSPQH